MCPAVLHSDHIAYFSKSKKKLVHLIYGGLSFVQKLYVFPLSRHAFYSKNENHIVLYGYDTSFNNKNIFDSAK
jgi:hypothetical protein